MSRNIKHKTHRLRVGDRARFKHAGRFRTGVVTELTRDPNGEATYTMCTSGDGRVYPRLGTNGSKWMGWVDLSSKKN